MAVVAGDPLRERAHVADRVELRLAVEHDGGRHGERQRQLGARGRLAHRQAGGARRGGDLLDRLDLVVVERVGDVGEPLPAAVDLPRLHLLLDPVERRERGSGVGGGLVGVVALGDSARASSAAAPSPSRS